MFPVLAIVGPTASGKEAVALEAARRLGAEILALDSMKVFRGLDIGTAKPSPRARERVPHHLLDLVDPGEAFSTRRWLTAAHRAEEEVRARGRLPLFVGGTALYLKALLFGLFPGPAADAGIRRRLKALPPSLLHRRLAEVDPEAAARIHENDLRRLVRALEVHEITGRPISALRREWDRAEPLRPAILAGLRRSREDLYRRIERRVDRMMAEGLLEEVRALLRRPGGLGPVASQALGYKELADHLEGRIPDLARAVEILKRRTRRFARRQLTWFKHFPIHWIEVAPEDPPERTAAAGLSVPAPPAPGSG